MEKLNFEDLMKKAQAGDKVAYTKLLHGVTPLIQNFLKTKLSNVENVNDITQEVLISVHKASNTYDPKRPFKTWLYAIIRYRLNDYLRSVYAKRNKGTDVNLDDASFDLFNEADVTNSYDAKEYMDKALSSLSKKQRKLIELTKIQGYSMKETASMVGMSESAVKVSVHRAMKDLSLKYAKDAF